MARQTIARPKGTRTVTKKLADGSQGGPSGISRGRLRTGRTRRRESPGRGRGRRPRDTGDCDLPDRGGSNAAAPDLALPTSIRAKRAIRIIRRLHIHYAPHSYEAPLAAG